MAISTLLPCVRADADLTLGVRAGAPSPSADSDEDGLRGVSASRDTDVVAVFGAHRLWWSRDGLVWTAIESPRIIDDAAVSRDGVVHVAGDRRIGVVKDAAIVWSEPGDATVGDGWRALVESRPASPSLQDPARLPPFASELGEISIDDGGQAQRLWGDSCPCEGGGQIRELGRPGAMHRDERWPDDDCKRGSGVGVHGWSYLVPECAMDAPIAELMARGADGREHTAARIPGACATGQPVLIASDGKRVLGLIGRGLWVLEGARAWRLDPGLPDARAFAVGRFYLWAVSGTAVYRWSGYWRRIDPAH